MTEEMKTRTNTPVDESIPLKERLDMPRLKAALAEPLYMNNFVAYKEDCSPVVQEHFVWRACGTIGCIAGNAVLNELTPKDRVRLANHELRFGGIRKPAARILGLTDAEAEELFYLAFPYETPGSPEYGGKVTAAVKEWLAAKNVPWEG